MLPNLSSEVSTKRTICNMPSLRCLHLINRFLLVAPLSGTALLPADVPMIYLPDVQPRFCRSTPSDTLDHSTANKSQYPTGYGHSRRWFHPDTNQSFLSHSHI